MPKKVLIFSLAYYPDTVGGAEIAIKEITDRIDPEEIEFHMITLQFNSKLKTKEKIGNVLIHRIGFSSPNPTTEDLVKAPLKYNKYIYQFTAPIKAWALHSKYKYDAVWAMMAHSCAVPVAIFNIFNPKIPYVLTLQEGDPLEQIEKTVKPVWTLFTRGFKKATIIQPISSFLADWAIKFNPRAKIELIPNGGNPKHFTNTISKNKIDNLKKKLEKKDDDIYLVTTGRLVHKNAVDNIIEALALLPENIYFLNVGDGPDKKKLEKLATKLKVQDRIKAIGWVDNTETPKYLKVSDIFIRPSRSEGLGISFISAMAAGLPIIGTQEGGIADFLFDAKRNPDKPTTGWAVDKNNPEQIAKAVIDILADPHKTKEITANAYELANKKYNWDSIVQNMKNQVFNKLFRK